MTVTQPAGRDELSFLAEMVAQIRGCAAETSGPTRTRLIRIGEQLLAYRNAVAVQMRAAPIAAPVQPAPKPDYSRNRTARAKNPGGARRCSICERVLPESAFGVTDRASGKLRSDCRDCYNARQRARYVSADRRRLIVSVLEGDPIAGCGCPVCGEPMLPGDRVQADAPRHAHCETPPPAATRPKADAARLAKVYTPEPGAHTAEEIVAHLAQTDGLITPDAARRAGVAVETMNRWRLLALAAETLEPPEKSVDKMVAGG